MSTPGTHRRRQSWMEQKERGSLFWLRVMHTFSLTVGRRASMPVVWLISLYFLLTSRKLRGAQRNYLRRVLPREPGWLDFYRHILCFATTIHDRSFLLSGREALFTTPISGSEALHDSIARGGGVLLFGAHLGSFEALRGLARQHPELRVCMTMHEARDQHINRALSAINPAALADLIPLGEFDAMLTVHQRLEEGALVGILADRASREDDFLRTDFLGSPADFPTGPFRLAAMLRRPVFFMSALYKGGAHYDLHFEPLADFSDTPAAARDAAIHDAIRRYAALMEARCHEAPLNWFNFFDFWESARADKP